MQSLCQSQPPMTITWVPDPPQELKESEHGSAREACSWENRMRQVKRQILTEQGVMDTSWNTEGSTWTSGNIPLLCGWPLTQWHRLPRLIVESNPWSSSKGIWTWSWAACSRCPCWSRDWSGWPRGPFPCQPSCDAEVLEGGQSSSRLEQGQALTGAARAAASGSQPSCSHEPRGTGCPPCVVS